MKKIYMTQPQGMCTVLRLQMHKIYQALDNAGCVMVEGPEDADVSILGNCAAFDADENRSIKLIEKVKSMNKNVYSYGCMCNVNPESLKAAKLFKVWEIEQLVNGITGGRGEFRKEEVLPDEFRLKEEYRVYDKSKRFLGITFGCPFECSYCPHQLGVGEPYSFPINEILSRIHEYNKSDMIRTLYITGTDTACYSDAGKGFAELLELILKNIRSNIPATHEKFRQRPK